MWGTRGLTGWRKGQERVGITGEGEDRCEDEGGNTGMLQEHEIDTDMGMCLAHGDSNEGSTGPGTDDRRGPGPKSPGLTLPPTTQGGSAARVGPSGSGGVAGRGHQIERKGLRTRRKRQVSWQGGEVAATVLWPSRGQRAMAQGSREGEMRPVPVHAWMWTWARRMGGA